MAHVHQEEICQMFDRIAHTYDPINRILSWGQDIRWRRRLVDELVLSDSLRILDIACGTADIAIALCQGSPKVDLVSGVDLSANMLSIGQKKIAKLGLDRRIQLQRADACALPFSDQSFDAVTIAFGIRNITRIDIALAEMARVLKPRGQALILEFSLPTNALIKHPYLLYFRHVLPWLGGMMSRDAQAYRYLNQTVESFLLPKEFSNRLLKAGFSRVSMNSLSFGIATLYSAEMS